LCDLILIFFLFKAEDGIRFRNVTGVQTCALPIYLTKRQFEGLYRDQIGYDEYLATARDAFLVADLLAGRDPLARITTSTEGEDSDNEVEYTSDQDFSYEDLHN